MQAVNAGGADDFQIHLFKPRRFTESASSPRPFHIFKEAHATVESSTPMKYSNLDKLAAAMVCLVLSVSVLYPEIFISGMPLISTGSTSPLSLLLPVVFAGAAYIVWKQRREIHPGRVDLLVLSYGGYLIIRNVVFSNNYTTVKYVIYGLSLYYLTSLLALKRENLLKIIGWTTIALIIVTALYGLVEYALQENIIYHKYIMDAVRDPRVGLHRVGSTLAHPVPYAAFLIQALPFTILFWASSHQRVTRAIVLAAALLGVMALFFTYSKGSWITVFIVVAAALIYTRGARIRKLVLPLLVVGTIVIIATVFFWQEIMIENEARIESSVDDRMLTWGAALDGIDDHPLFGVGYRRGEEEITKHLAPDSYDTAIGMPVDNYYLSLMLESGILGFAIWVVMFVLIIAEGVGAVNGPGGGWALAALASILCISLNAVTFEAMHIWPNFIFFWITAGMLHGIARSHANEPAPAAAV